MTGKFSETGASQKIKLLTDLTQMVSFSNENFRNKICSVTIESAAQKAANRTAQAILSGKYNKKLKDENLDDFIEVLLCHQTILFCHMMGQSGVAKSFDAQFYLCVRLDSSQKDLMLQ